MVNQFVVNLFVAFVWASLQAEFTALNFVIGFILGGILLSIFSIVSGEKDSYFTRIMRAVRLILVFIKEVIVANVIVIRQVLSPKLNIKPGIVALPLDLETDMEITVLASMISLTPGTISMYVSNDNRYLYIHVMNIEDGDKIIDDIKDTFEKGIMGVTGRC